MSDRQRNSYGCSGTREKQPGAISGPEHPVNLGTAILCHACLPHETSGASILYFSLRKKPRFQTRFPLRLFSVNWPFPSLPHRPGTRPGDWLLISHLRLISNVGFFLGKNSKSVTTIKICIQHNSVQTQDWRCKAWATELVLNIIIHPITHMLKCSRAQQIRLSPSLKCYSP